MLLWFRGHGSWPKNINRHGSRHACCSNLWWQQVHLVPWPLLGWWYVSRSIFYDESSCDISKGQIWLRLWVSEKKYDCTRSGLVIITLPEVVCGIVFLLVWRLVLLRTFFSNVNPNLKTCFTGKARPISLEFEMFQNVDRMKFHFFIDQLWL